MSSAPAPSLKDIHLAKSWDAVRTARPEQDRQGLPSRTWSTMSLRTRAVLVMLGATSMEDARQVARRPWESLSQADRQGIAACARDLGKDLRDSACLF